MPLSRIQSYSNSLSDDTRWNLLLPSAPLSVTVVAGNTQATVSWTAPSFIGTPITNYSIQYSSNGGSSWTTFNKAASTSTSSVVTGLTNNVGYIFRVAAINAVGTGSYSTPSSLVIVNIISSISGLRLWLDAADTSTLFDATSGGSLVQPSGSVAQWQDKSGNGYHATQSNASSRPTQSATGLVFNGTSSHILCPTASFALGAGDFAIFCVATLTAGSASSDYRAIYGSQDNSGDYAPIVRLMAYPPSQTMNFALRGPGGGPATNAASSASVATGSPIVYEASRISSTANLVVGNDPAVTFSYSGDITISTNMPIGAWLTVGLGAGTQAYWSGRISELIVYKATLTLSQRQAVRTYLSSKWGIS
jgi:hypothetical protein